MFPHALSSIQSALHHYGYLAVGLGLMLESLGLPLAGESLLIAAAAYAAATHQLDIAVVVPVAAAGAICGDQIGYFIGRSIGYRLLARWGSKIGLSGERLTLGRYLFCRWGGRVVFAGRFIAVLRTFAALLAGANRMPWHSFVVWNALGGICWTSLYGFGAYWLGDEIHRLKGPIGIALGVIGGAVILVVILFIRRNEQRLLSEAQVWAEKQASRRPRSNRVSSFRSQPPQAETVADGRHQAGHDG